MCPSFTKVEGKGEHQGGGWTFKAIIQEMLLWVISVDRHKQLIWLFRLEDLLYPYSNHRCLHYQLMMTTGSCLMSYITSVYGQYLIIPSCDHEQGQRLNRFIHLGSSRDAASVLFSSHRSLHQCLSSIQNLV